MIGNIISSSKLVIGVAIAAVVGMQHLQIRSLESELKVSTKNAATLEHAVKTQTDTITQMNNSMTAMLVSNAQLHIGINNIREEAAKRKTNINNARGRLHELSLKKPESVRRIINDGTVDIMREFEQATGSKDSTTNKHNSATPAKASGS